jgi:DNA-directed RNA polymerase specialized sigma24 family protein
MSDLDVHLHAIAAGDARAFGRWVAGAEARVRLSLTSFATAVDVEAVVQESLLRVWQVAPRFQPDGRPNALLRFAVRCARNVAVSELRKRGTRPAAGAYDADQEQRPIEPDPALRELIALCRERLPGKPAQALLERLANGANNPDRDLAANVGMTLNTFLQNFGRARKLMADCLKRQGVQLEFEPRPRRGNEAVQP